VRIERRETWEQCALRECRSETGWHVGLRAPLEVYSDPATQVHQYPDGRVVQLL
jgi:8-oxo-dGTP diphosphatase